MMIVQNFHSVELLCQAMLTHLDLSFPDLGIRTVSDQEFLREVEVKMKGLEKQVSGLQTKVSHST